MLLKKAPPCQASCSPHRKTHLDDPMPKSDSTKLRSVLCIALISRIILTSLIAAWRYLASPYDTSASLNPPCLLASPTTNPSLLLPRLGSAVEDTIVWDAVYFVRIAECGYEYEQTYAFLPLLPLCMRALSKTIFAPLVPIFGYRAVLGLSGYVLNNVAFLFAAVYLYKLSVLILKDSNVALRASVLFCFNPASIFYSSIYSESLYSLFSFGGFYHLFSGANIMAVFLLALSGSARSNGVLNAGYFCFQAMHQAYDALIWKKRPGLAVKELLMAAVRTLCIFAPFIGFQAYAYCNICLGRTSEESRPWCKARVPLLYDFLQSHYWGVGFLRYFQMKQLPNFLLASPILCLAVCSIIKYTKLRPEVVFSLGFQAPTVESSGSLFYPLGMGQKLRGTQPLAESSSLKSSREDVMIRQRKQKTGEESGSSWDTQQSDHEVSFSTNQGYASVVILPFILHMGFMTAVAFFIMHVQVSTRFLSASPPIFWFISYLMVEPRDGRRWSYLIWAYFTAYILLGSLLFSNFYPFT